MALEALPHRCEEASPFSTDAYIPCNAPATRNIFMDNRVYRMCAPCHHHNLGRGGVDRGPYEAEKS